MTALPRDVRRALIWLVALGATTHLLNLTSPREVVFDEVTMGGYVRAYCCTGERVLDMHPPHAKLLIAAVVRLAGFDGAFTFEKIGLPYGDTPVFALRLVPALAGILIPPLFLLLLLELGASFPIAALGGLLLALDNALLLETRIIVWDGILVAATLGSLVCFLSAQRAPARIGWRILAAGALAGLAVGSKLTGLAAPALMMLCLAAGLGVVRAPWRARVVQALVICGAAFAVYAAGWVAHWLLLTQPGPGDAFYQTTGRMLDDILAVHRAMVRENVALVATHPDASRPWTWPWMQVAPYFWQGPGAFIYLLGNPVVWWGTALLFLSIIVRLGLMAPLGLGVERAVNAAPRPYVALAGYAIAFLPLLPVTRVLFLYHYLTPLVFSVAFVLLWLDRAGWARPGGLRDQRLSYFIVMVLVVIGFLAVSPLTYGFSAGGYDEWLAALVRSWR
jgi:dolichyl-phosphate-mannose-protein mannosyltransferase